MSKDFWKHGDQTLIAHLTGLTDSYFSGILGRNKSVSPKRAIMLERITKRFFGKNKIPKEIWVFNKITTHPAFYGKPKKYKNN